MIRYQIFFSPFFFPLSGKFYISDLLNSFQVIKTSLRNNAKSYTTCIWNTKMSFKKDLRLATSMVVKNLSGLSQRLEIVQMVDGNSTLPAQPCQQLSLTGNGLYFTLCRTALSMVKYTCIRETR